MDKFKVFIVDDDQDFAESVADVLELKGYHVHMAFSGEDAVRKFKEEDFDITFMDVKLPGKNGVESFLEIKDIRPSAKVIMMTGYSVEQLLDEAVEKGAWGVLHKPLDMNHVLSQLETIRPDGVMIVDDDLDFVDSIKEVLEESGYRIFVAADGHEAVARMKDNQIDVLILDLRLPMLNGLEIYLKLKEMQLLVPTIIVTAYAQEEKERLDLLKNLQVTGILTKPFDPQELLESIDNIRKLK